MKFLLGIAAALGVAAFAYAAAADVNVTGGALQQGTDDTLKCTENVSVNFENSDGLGIADIVVAGFDPACVDPANPVYFYLVFFDENGNEISSCPEDTTTGPPGGIEITGTEVTLDDDNNDCDGVSIPDTYAVQVTIVGGGTTPYSP